MADPMRIRATLQGDVVDVRILISHEMESGQRRDASGALIPAHFIQEVVVTHAGKTVMRAHWGPAISKNPFLGFRFRGGRKGDKVAVSWLDNKGDRGAGE